MILVPIEDYYKCEKDGVFHWRGFYSEPGGFNLVVGKMEEIRENFIEAKLRDNKLLVTVRCPKCKKNYSFYKNK